MPIAEVKVVAVESVKKECDDVFTIRFIQEDTARPGQFAMIIDPTGEEVPMSYSYVEEKKGVSFKVVGEGTKLLSRKTPGDKLGVKGPLGNTYEIKGGETFVAGGTGIASIAPAVEEAVGKGSATVILGARTEGFLFFINRFEKAGVEVLIATDDGTCGRKCFSTEIFEERVGQCTRVITCGPEVMMKKVVDACLKKNIHVQASLERHMKCGAGVCDACSVNGRLVCRDGPVFRGRQLKGMDEFGRKTRAVSGRLENI